MRPKGTPNPDRAERRRRTIIGGAVAVGVALVVVLGGAVLFPDSVRYVRRSRPTAFGDVDRAAAEQRFA